MDIAQLNEFREILENQLEQLLHAARGSVVSLMELDGHVADPMDRATVESGRDYTFRIRTRESFLIRKLRKSLEAIENGEFGICQQCGDEISLARLKARPVTQYCISCKTELEKWEKAAGL